jgi:ATP-binding cassette subfamily B protein
VKLSGGERQRVAIARAMLTDSPLLVLDEATSALDSKSEKYITRALDELMKGRTTIVIAHRLSTIQKLDRIIVLKDGEIIEDGTHDELLARDGEYAELWNHQTGGFLDE